MKKCNLVKGQIKRSGNKIWYEVKHDGKITKIPMKRHETVVYHKLLQAWKVEQIETVARVILKKTKGNLVSMRFIVAKNDYQKLSWGLGLTGSISDAMF